LKDHLHASAIPAEIATAVQCEDIPVSKHHVARGRRIESSDQARHRALPAAALSHESKDAAPSKLKANVIDGMNPTARTPEAAGAPGREVFCQSLDVHHDVIRRCHGARLSQYR
jgi:hypothetical protein